MSEKVVLEGSVLSGKEAERAEVEVVLATLVRSPRLARLLRYLTDKYFQEQTDELTEFNIATEVFGRSKTVFNSSEDAIARAEIHRLRKRLKVFYETEGKDHLVQIALPTGTYVPCFIHLAPQISACAQPEIPADSAQAEHTSIATSPQWGVPGETEELVQESKPVERKDWSFKKAPLRLYAIAAAAAVLIVFLTLRHRTIAQGGNTSQNFVRSQEPVTDNRNQLPSVTLPLRLLAGYSGPPQRDSVGDIWQPDQYFHGGWPLQQPSVFVARTSDPFIFRNTRSGDCQYDIPLKPGSYELHLFFIKTSTALQIEDAEDKTSFNVSINGQLVLSDFDIASDAMGRNVADERVFRDISPANDGRLHIWLSTKIGTPALSAIEILEGTPHKQLPIRIVTQPAPFTDHKGQLWHPDDHYLDGRHLAHNSPSISPDPDLLLSERYGHFTYAIPVDTRDRYTVVLHFAELYFGTANISGPGQRVFRVLCNGTTLLDDFDIFKEAGSFHTVTKTFHHLKPTAQGKLNLTFEPVVNYATLSAIEVLDELN